jgi:hypothetical protein
MKKNRNTFLFIASAMVLSLVSCQKDFVDIQPKGQFLTAMLLLLAFTISCVKTPGGLKT